ncbi:hypothetical protein C8R47DRAFT_1138188 [Mycena vitilis]|nr:hypothetical protein C8R47DRAFT_1138188 [Mycena vitilis]
MPLPSLIMLLLPTTMVHLTDSTDSLSSRSNKLILTLGTLNAILTVPPEKSSVTSRLAVELEASESKTKAAV